ncbi:MAG: hypothetical protein RB191_10310, partial [Terriglobia bacterium]|nr:hypothetical protein [Terriglobia bacterium]
MDMVGRGGQAQAWRCLLASPCKSYDGRQVLYTPTSLAAVLSRRSVDQSPDAEHGFRAISVVGFGGVLR